MKTTFLAIGITLALAGTAAAEACRDGAALLADTRDLTALRDATDAACPCDGFTAVAGDSPSAYRRCARRVRDEALAGGRLRRECRMAATRAYLDTTCGTTGKVACGRVTPTAVSRPVTCRIKPAASCVDLGRYTESVCTGETHCSDVVEHTAGTCVETWTAPYGEGWSAVHADASNTDYSPIPGAADVRLKWQRTFDGAINLGPTSDPSGRVYVTENSNDAGCHLHVLDGSTGETLWCTAEVDRFAVASAALLDRDGRIFLADSEAMHAFDRNGNVLWKTPIVGVPLSAQFTAEGRVIFVTHVGVLYLLKRETGAHVLPPIELVPGASWKPSDGMSACLQGTPGCPSANTPAMDHRTGRLVFTFWAPGAPQAGVRAMHVTEDPVPAITLLWSNDNLPGGSASSPTLSADGSRVYVNDNVDSLHALDAATGEEIWSFAIGAAPGGSPSLSPCGLVMPSGSAQGVVMAVQDEGATASLAWRNDAMINRGIPTQVAGDLAYATVNAGGLRNDLVVLDTRTGDELDREALPGTTAFTVGTTIAADGTILVPTFLGQLFAFGPQ